jgi:hypothetical protein
MTPSLSNVEILDSGAIKRRKGYVKLLSTAIANAEVKSLHRFYMASGNRQWLALCGTGVYEIPTLNYVAPRTVQAETLCATPNVVQAPAMSGGAAIQLTGTSDVCNLSIPNCTAFGITGMGHLQFSVDGGAWVSATLGHNIPYSVSGLNATTHTVAIKMV